MPFTYKIIHEQKIVIVRAIGVIDFQSSVQAMQDVVADIDFDPNCRAIIDLRKMLYNPSISELFAIRTSIVSAVRNFKGEITLVTTKEFLHSANLVCILAKVYNVKISAVCEFEGLDDLELGIPMLTNKQLG